jgi:phosphate:Na+ symporter
VTTISPTHNDLFGTQKLAAEAPRQIANAHTLFNVANTFIFIGFTTLIARFIEWLIPDRPMDVESVVSAKYLDTDVLSTPSIALDLVRREIKHMGTHVVEMISDIMPAILHGSAKALDAVRALDERVDFLHAEIVIYLGRISQSELTEKQTVELMHLMDAANDLENIGDVVEMNLVELGRQRIGKGLAISPPTQVVLSDFHQAVLDAVGAAIRAVGDDDYAAAQTVTGMKQEISRIANSAAAHEAQRLVANEPHRIEAYTVEMDITEKLQRIYYFARRMARTVTQ